MLKQLLYILIALLVAFILVNAAWRIYRKKRRDAVKRLKTQDRRYIDLERERLQILEERVKLDGEHPYQRVLDLKIRAEKASTFESERLLAERERILQQNNTTEERLREDFSEKIATMTARLGQIELEQRRLIIEAEKVLDIS